jgi:hypothetical protein
MPPDMYLLLTDETNSKPSEKAKFFVLGGLIVDFEALPALHARIHYIRQKYGYKPGDLLKFDTHSRPKHLTIEKATAAKNAVIEACIGCKCKFIAYVVLHDIAKKKPAETQLEWGANCIVQKFNEFLLEQNSHGIVAMDRFPAGNDYSFLTDKFCNGLKFQDEGQVPLGRIKLFTSTCINASHASSAVDIALGTFRYCINQPANVEAAKVMMENISKMIWCERDGNTLLVQEKGLICRPKKIDIAKYSAEYDTLIDNINKLLEDATL